MKTIYYNGRVYTGELPLAEAFVVADGKFLFAGSNQEAMEKASNGTELVDLNGRFVCAGFNDSHMHLLAYGNALQSAELAKHTQSISDMVAYMKDFLAAHPVTGNGWLYGRGWNHDYFADADRMPNRQDLDKVSTEVPVVAVRACGHCLVVNTKALEVIGVTVATPQPDGGKIGIEDGMPDGRFFDNAMDMVYDAVPVPDKEGLKDRIRAACKALNAYGVTSSQTDDYCLFRAVPWQTVNEAYRELEESGELTVRVYEQSNFTTVESLTEFVEAGNVTGVGTELFKIGPLKMLGDGALGARTAFLSRPYADDPDATGLPVFTQEVMDDMVDYANAHNMQVAIHAIGDACLDRVLHAVENALKNNPRQDHRHGVVHCQITRPDQLDKIAELNMHVYAQSIFLDYDNHIVEQRVGKELAATSYNWKTLMDKGVAVSNGTDCPVELPFAMGGIQCAVTRTTLRDHVGPYLPDQAFTVQEALDSYTSAAAKASFEEAIKGRIAAGMLADFVVLDQDPFAVDPSTIQDIAIHATYLGGKKVFQAE